MNELKKGTHLQQERLKDVLVNVGEPNQVANKEDGHNSVDDAPPEESGVDMCGAACFQFGLGGGWNPQHRLWFNDHAFWKLWHFPLQECDHPIF